MRKTGTENLEISLLLDAILKQYGYDFRNYSQASFKRRIKAFLNKKGVDLISELIPRLIHDKKFFESLLHTLTITVTEMFRDPPVYKAIREHIVPVLRTYPFIRIWHAGCATGEEVYSMAILLEQEGLYERSQIYATDINSDSLDTAKHGTYPISAIKKYTSNYHNAGGDKPLSEYYHSDSNSIIMSSDLKKNILFSPHNLVTDSVFGEMHLIICRNVLIYFNRTLQDRVLNLFCDSLVRKGFLCLGDKESLRFSNIADKFVTVGSREKLYQTKPSTRSSHFEAGAGAILSIHETAGVNRRKSRSTQ